jgi:hypothetical protein
MIENGSESISSNRRYVLYEGRGCSMDEGYFPPDTAPQLPAPEPQRSGVPRWALIGGGALALVAILGAGVLIGSVARPQLAQAFGVQQAQNGTVGYHGGFGDHGPGKGPGALTITDVASDSIATKRADGTAVTVKTTSSTQYLRAGKTIDRSALTAGTAIRVQGTRNSDGSVTATRIDIALAGAHGKVTAINGNDIAIQNERNTSSTQIVHTSSSTTFTRAGQTSSLSAVTVGGEISAQGVKNSDGSLQAEAVRIVLPHAGGQITAVNGSTLTVQNRSGTQTIHLSASAKITSVTFGTSGPTESPATASDLKTGVYIQAEGTQASDGSLNAEVVKIVPAHAGGPGGRGPGKPHSTQTPTTNTQ